ncbi:hypothetical protein [Bradyrhizobium sp. WSM1253]|uniref:hypothetical protein n=1 Tax=Bradyrhizobium sp. WSM1253 TaxID=319003 RepID=UPI000302D27F|nr:hypothetical protein [Bradyrhizobium sp. WSM1253]
MALPKGAAASPRQLNSPSFTALKLGFLLLSQLPPAWPDLLQRVMDALAEAAILKQ